MNAYDKKKRQKITQIIIKIQYTLNSATAQETSYLYILSTEYTGINRHVCQVIPGLNSRKVP